MRGNTQCDGRPLGLQRRFPMNDNLLRSGDIRDQVAKLCEIAPKFDVLGPPNFGGRATQISDRII